MDLSYNVMRFGPKKRRIKIVHLKKPVTKGLAGLIESNLFPQRIAIVVFKHDATSLVKTSKGLADLI